MSEGVAGRSHTNKRQEAKLRTKLVKDLYFLVQWCDNAEDVMYDTLPAKDITPSSKEKDVLDLHPGDECKASFANTLYPAKVIAVGKYNEIKLQQRQKEKEAEQIEMSNEQESEKDCEEEVRKTGRKEERQLECEQKEKGRSDNGTKTSTKEKTASRKGGNQHKEHEHLKSRRMSQFVTTTSTKHNKKMTKSPRKNPPTSYVSSEEEREEDSEDLAKTASLKVSHEGSQQKHENPKSQGKTQSVKANSTKHNRKLGKSSCKNPSMSYISSEEREEDSEDGAKTAAKVATRKDRKSVDDGESYLNEYKHPKSWGKSSSVNTPSTKFKAVHRKVGKSPCKNLLASYISSDEEEEDLETTTKEKTTKNKKTAQTKSAEEESQQREHQHPKERSLSMKSPFIKHKNKVAKSPQKKPVASSDSSSELSDEEFPAKKKKKQDDFECDVSFEARRIKNIAENELFKKMIGLGPAMLPTTITSEVTKLKEKVRILEKSHMSLKRKLSEQEAELTHLRRLTSSEVSSSAEPDNSVFLSPQGPFKRSPVYSSPPTIKRDNTPDFLKEADAVKLANAKLQPDAGTTALKLMDCVFTTTEMVNGNPSGVTRSKDETRQKTIQALDVQKMRYIDSILQEKWGVTTADKVVR